MTDLQQQEKAALYVLDLLESVDRAAFELELSANEALRSLVAELREGLADASLADLDPVDPPVALWSAIALQARATPQVAGVGVGVGAGAARRGAGHGRCGGDSGGRSFGWAWPAAAAILLSLNILQFSMRHMEESAAEQTEAARMGVVASTSGEQGLADGADGLEPEVLQAQLLRLRQVNDALERQIELQNSMLAVHEEELRELRDDSLLSAGERHRLFEEYQRLAARVMPYFEPVGGLSRFTVIELVDVNTYASDGPRRGFTDIAQRLLEDLNSGNIASATPAFEVPTVEPARVTPPEGGADRAQTTAPAPAVPGFAGPPGADTSSAPGAIGEDADPAAFTVWRDDEQKGFLDIYNLPLAPEGSGYQLWVRASELEPYLSVGVLPADDDGYLSLFYEVDVPNFSPTEVLITLESEPNPEQPGGTVILRGP